MRKTAISIRSLASWQPRKVL